MKGGAIQARAFLLPILAASLAIFWPWTPALGDSPAAALRTGDPEALAARIALGKAIFFDPALSEPRGTSCASCHDPNLAFSGDRGSGVGVPAGSRPGSLAKRTTPSLLYLSYVPRFRFFSDDRDDNERGGHAEPYGGFFWDGRADSIAALVRQPLLNPREMNNRDAAQIADKLRLAPYANAFRREFPGALDDAANPDVGLDALGTALEAFLTSPAMAPFSSKFDDYVRGRVTLTPKEAEGLRLFKDRRRGNCAKCHTVFDTALSPQRSMFTDYGYEAVGAPGNARLRQRDEDLGLCERTDPSNPTTDAKWCATFRTPSLRNVALRKGFMHNGAFTSLRDVVRFYATRSTDPDKWYPSGVAFDDTPAAYRAHVSVGVVPYDRHKGDPPALDDSEVDAIVAFLGTLTDRRP